MFAIKGAVLLDGVVCQMDHLITDVVEVVVLGCSADVPLSVPVGSHCPVQPCYYHVVTDVEFTPFVEEGVFNVLLHYVGLWVAVCVLLLSPEDAHKGVQLVHDYDAVASV